MIGNQWLGWSADARIVGVERFMSTEDVVDWTINTSPFSEDHIMIAEGVEYLTQVSAPDGKTYWYILLQSIIPLLKPTGSPGTLSRDSRALLENILLTRRNTTGLTDGPEYSRLQ